MKEGAGVENLSFYSIKLLPPSMMKVTQSVSQVTEYSEKSDSKGEVIHKHRKKGEGRQVFEEIEETLEENVQRHCFYSVDDEESKLRNMLIQHRFNKYLGILVRDSLQES